MGLRVAVVLGVALFTCAGIATAAAPTKNHFKSFFINCGNATTKASAQLCPRPPKIESFATIKTSASPVTVTYIASGGHCSPVKMIVYVDGKRVGETPVLNANGIGKLSFHVTPGAPHRLGFVEQGFVGGCNSGELVSIAGKIETTYTP
jgi:hypothetical protein